MTAASPSSTWPARDAHHLLVSAAEMAGLEKELFGSGLPVESLMEKAALAVSRRLLASNPEAVLVLVGPGHNGGDGLVVARELHLAGVPVRIWSAFPRHRPLTDAHLRHACWLGIPLLEEAPDPGDPALWIDALFGTGQNRPPGEALEALLEQREQRRPGALEAIDVPTGLCADNGRPLGRLAARARRTWCLGLLKRGLVQDGSLHWVGRLERIDLGLPAALLATLPDNTPLALAEADIGTAPWRRAEAAATKYQRGRLLVVAGSHRYRGAAHLALSGASASGCGSLRAALPLEVAADLWSVHPHVVLEPGLGALTNGGLALADLEDGWLERLDAVLLGPGLGGGETDPGTAVARHWGQLRDFPGLLVLDADGLNRLAEGRETGEEPLEWLRRRRGPTWLTPHAGEFARLFPAWADRPPLEAALGAARASGTDVLLKGARTVVATADGRRWQLLEAEPATARTGLGDVLAGYAAGRGAQSLAAGGLDGALLAAAALEHASAGRAARALRGPGGSTPLAVAQALEQRGTANVESHTI